MQYYYAIKLFGFYILVILSLAFITSSNEIDDKLSKSVEKLQNSLKAKCDDKSKQ
jgi:hypothetical protein